MQFDALSSQRMTYEQQIAVDGEFVCNVYLGERIQIEPFQSIVKFSLPQRRRPTSPSAYLLCSPAKWLLSLTQRKNIRKWIADIFL